LPGRFISRFYQSFVITAILSAAIVASLETTNSKIKNYSGDMKVKKLYTLVIAALFLTVLNFAATAQTKDIVAPQSFDVTGTWLFDLECNCEGIAAKGNLPMALNLPSLTKSLTEPDTLAPFNAVGTFNSDGTFAENTFVEYLSPQTTAARGVWERVSSRQVAVTLYGIIIGSSSQPEFQGTYKVRWNLYANQRGDRLSGPYVVDIYAPDGSLLFSFGGTSEGRRARSERLQ
jgi:hypothetical protein